MIQYLIYKFIQNEQDSNNVQTGLIVSLAYIVALFRENMFILKEPKLQPNDILEIFSSVLPNIHDYDMKFYILNFNFNCDFYFVGFFDFIKYIKFTDSVYLIDYFKIIDHLFNYYFFSLNIKKHFFKDLCSTRTIFYFESKIEIIASIVLYLLHNDFLDGSTIMR